MNWVKVLILLALVVLVLYWGFSPRLPQPPGSETLPRGFWEVQSVDTTKYSRDSAEAVLKDPRAFDLLIESQVKSIADLGATHVGLGTPYDEEFLPVLKVWVAAARRHDLKVWFRGNFAGWEGWFAYPRISREAHLKKTEDFILKNNELFADGDIFTPCPECENGGPGDPRRTDDLASFRKFLIDEYQITRNGFDRINRQVKSNYLSLNGDVARLVMDQETTKALGGVVTIDHYVKNPERLATDIEELAKQTGGRVVLGEFGAPIPEVHGKMTAAQQAKWIETSLASLVTTTELLGMNYWVNAGGSTSLWEKDGSPRPAAAVVQKYFRPKIIGGVVRNELGKPVARTKIKHDYREVETDTAGNFQIPVLEDGNQPKLKISAAGYREQELDLKELAANAVREIVLVRQDRPWWFRVKLFLKSR